MKTVLTTIFNPSPSVYKLMDCLQSCGAPIIVIGDEKGPENYNLQHCEFYPLEDQLDLPYQMARLLPTGHYSRKNLGYLIAIAAHEDCIYETDDDNAPNEYWRPRNKTVRTLTAEPSPWINVYRHFSQENIWPRGFLLDRITSRQTFPAHNGILAEITAPIQQGLVDLSPDVDALWRLTRDREFFFERKESLALPPGAWCPFNTQSTWWWSEAFPLMYLPSCCSFRMTDIWRSFVAQRCLWTMGYPLVFHAAEVVQNRNVHNLMGDFEAEIPGYTLNEKITKTLEALDLPSGSENALDNLIRCYEALIAQKIFPEKEMKLVKAWADDIEKSLL